MAECYFCGRNENEAELLDVIDGAELIKACKECLRRENLPVVQKPDYSQIAESEKPYTVYERLSRMAGLQQKPKPKKEEYIPQGITLDKLRKPIDYNTKTLRKDYTIIEKPIDLVDNFNWFIQTTRRRMNLSQKQLADAIGEREEKITIIEEGNLPENAEKIISKLEQFLKIKLIKGSPIITEEIKIKPTITKKEEWSYSETKEEPVFVRAKPEKKSESSYILKIDREKIKNLTIADLQRMKKEKEKIEKIKEFSEENEKTEEEKYKKKIEKEAEKEMGLKEINDMIWRRTKKQEKKEEEKYEESNEAEKLIEEVKEEDKEEKKPSFFARIFRRKKKEENKEK